MPSFIKSRGYVKKNSSEFKPEIFKKDYCILNAQKNFHKWEVKKQVDKFLKSVYPLSYGKEYLLFSIQWKIFRVMQDWKIKSSGLQIDLPHL